jgi:Outer membrane protein beta-barrel domain
MYSINVRDQFPIFSSKVNPSSQPLKLSFNQCTIALILFFGLLSSDLFAQNFQWARRNNPEYDKRKITYGFSIGLHTTAYQIKYNDNFLNTPYDTVHSIQTSFSPGFSLGFLVNLRFNDQLDLRLMPKASFYEHRLHFNYTTRGREDVLLLETTMVELPLLLKYKSQRRGNVRMYVVGGIAPGFEARNRGDFQSNIARLEVKKGNLSIDLGLGWDLYFAYFKLSPELRFSKGITNLLTGGNPFYADPIKRLNTNTISVFFIFQ